MRLEPQHRPRVIKDLRPILHPAGVESEGAGIALIAPMTLTCTLHVSISHHLKRDPRCHLQSSGNRVLPLNAFARSV
jgi:hypothetical protein